MAYSAAQHQLFTKRMRNFAIGYEGALAEAEALDQIYTNETASGTDPDFIDTEFALEAEHVDLITFIRSFVGFTKGTTDEVQLDRRPMLTPFSQNIQV